jgi:hypothetical protein
LLICTPLTTICSVAPVPTVVGLAVDVAGAAVFVPPPAEGAGAGGAADGGAVWARLNSTDATLVSIAAITRLSFVPK